MCLQVAWDDTIVVVKAMIQAKEYIARRKQVLKFKDVVLEDSQTLLSYDIMPGSTLELGRLPGGGKRAAPGNEGGREDKDTKIRILRQEIMANVILMQNSPNPVTQAIRARVMQLERDTAELEHDEIFERLYENMGEKQMLKLQEKFVASGRNVNQRYTAIAKSIFEREFQMIEDTKREMDTMAKMLNDCAMLTTVTQYSSDAGVLNWEDFQKGMNKTATEKSREADARGE